MWADIPLANALGDFRAVPYLAGPLAHRPAPLGGGAAGGGNRPHCDEAEDHRSLQAARRDSHGVLLAGLELLGLVWETAAQWSRNGIPLLEALPTGKPECSVAPNQAEIGAHGTGEEPHMHTRSELGACGPERVVLQLYLRPSS